jgi:hypothetical protein
LFKFKPHLTLQTTIRNNFGARKLVVKLVKRVYYTSTTNAGDYDSTCLSIEEQLVTDGLLIDTTAHAVRHSRCTLFLGNYLHIL